MVYTLAEKRRILADELLKRELAFLSGQPWGKNDSIVTSSYERQIANIDRLMGIFPGA